VVIWLCSDGQNIRSVNFNPVYPARTAGGKQRQVSLLPEMSEKLAGFFHNGEVGRGVGVEYIIETQLSQCIEHSADAT